MRISDWSLDVCSSDLSATSNSIKVMPRWVFTSRLVSRKGMFSRQDAKEAIGLLVATKEPLNKPHLTPLRAACPGVWNCTRIVNPTGGGGKVQRSGWLASSSARMRGREIGRAHVGTPVTNAQ